MADEPDAEDDALVTEVALRLLTQQLVDDLCRRLRAEADDNPASPWLRHVLAAGLRQIP